MGLINRVAISNVLNYYGDGQRKQWSPRFRYECLDFRGQSTAVNLTNGGGKTTLAEAMLAVLSRDKTLVTRTKKKFSPQSCSNWSHVQVELIRPTGNTGQSDFITAQGNEVNGEHWVFGMYGHRSDQGMNYYYFKGRLEDLPVGEVDGNKRILIKNQAFVQARKAIPGLVMAPHEDEWQEALALKVNLPQSTIKQMTDFQKRGGQDKSALLYEIKPRPGQSYAEVFFYRVLAPAIMEGVMDSEGEEGEVRLEDTVERSVFSTVKAKQDTAARRRETEELSAGVEQLTELMKVAGNAEELRDEFERHLTTIQTDVQVLTELVGKSRLPGVPKATLPEGLMGEVAKHLVVEPGSTEVRILDRGLSVLLEDESKNVNRRAERNNLPSRESTQVIEIPCHLFLQEKGVRGNKPKSYSIEDATALLNAASSIGHCLTKEAAIEYLEDAVSWFDHEADTNPYRQQLVDQQADTSQLTQNLKALEVQMEHLQTEQLRLQQQQTRMEANEGLYSALVDSGLFSDEELRAPMKTAGAVKQTLEEARIAMREFEKLEAQLNEHRDAWEAFAREYGRDSDPGAVLDEKEAERQHLVNECAGHENALANTRQQLKDAQERSHSLQREQDKASQKLERFAEHREGYERFVERFGNISPKSKEKELRSSLRKAEGEISRLLPLQMTYQEGVTALQRYHETVSVSVTPTGWLEQAAARRAELAVVLNEAGTNLQDLQNQREALENERIAANAATRKALDCLNEKSIAHQPLHQVIASLDLSPARNRQVLGTFSALLFAPVLRTEDEAHQAAMALAEIGAQIPVFIQESIESYCRDAEIESCLNGELLIGTTSGIITRSVDCLLDPGLVEREKAALDSRVETLKNDIQNMESERASIAEDSESVVLAQRARKAVDNEESEKLNQVEEELDHQRDLVEQLTELTSDAVMTAIRSAEAMCN